MYGFLGFGSFSILWTSLAFLLDHALGYNQAVIGMFGLVGAAGAIAARVAGPLTDRGHDKAATGTMFAVILLGWVLLGLGGGTWVITVIAGVILVDLGVQGAHVTNLGVIYRVPPEVRSRATTAYMTSVFLGGVVGSAVSGAAYADAGWVAVCVGGGLSAVLGLVLWAATARRTGVDHADRGSGRTQA